MKPARHVLIEGSYVLTMERINAVKLSWGQEGPIDFDLGQNLCC